VCRLWTEYCPSLILCVDWNAFLCNFLSFRLVRIRPRSFNLVCIVCQLLVCSLFAVVLLLSSSSRGSLASVFVLSFFRRHFRGRDIYCSDTHITSAQDEFDNFTIQKRTKSRDEKTPESPRAKSPQAPEMSSVKTPEPGSSKTTTSSKATKAPKASTSKTPQTTSSKTSHKKDKKKATPSNVVEHHSDIEMDTSI
jgi:hypothetical protein